MIDELKEKKDDKERKGRIKEETKEVKEEHKEVKRTPVIKTEPRKRSPIEILLREKPSKLFLLLLQDKQWRISMLARESNQSYVYATELIKQFEEAGLITVNTDGKRKEPRLTEKGEKLAKIIQELISLTTAA